MNEIEKNIAEAAKVIAKSVLTHERRSLAHLDATVDRMPHHLKDLGIIKCEADYAKFGEDRSTRDIFLDLCDAIVDIINDAEHEVSEDFARRMLKDFNPYYFTSIECYGLYMGDRKGEVDFDGVWSLGADGADTYTSEESFAYQEGTLENIPGDDCDSEWDYYCKVAEIHSDKTGRIVMSEFGADDMIFAICNNHRNGKVNEADAVKMIQYVFDWGAK